MADRPRPRRPVVLLVPTLTILGCSGVEPAPSGSAPVPAEVLADHAERLADHLRVANGCRTLAEAEALLERAADGVAIGELPREVAAEIRRVVAAVTINVTCGTEPAPDDEQPVDETPVDPEDGSEATSTGAPASEPAPAIGPTAGADEAEKRAPGKAKQGDAPGRSKRSGARGRGGGR